MPNRVGPAILVLAFLVLLLALMYWGWLRRRSRTAPLDRGLASVPDTLTDPFTCDTLYVATTRHGAPLDRVPVSGLAFRARARLTVADEGVLIAARGEREVFIPAGDVRAVEQATWTIDRVVEERGLTVITWSLSGETLDSAFRLFITDDQTTVIDRLLTLSGGPAPTSERDSAE